jgi:predicted anti-sigma-YlaC factor YlaD
MPVTLFLLYRAMPDSPGLAFGLAASALWPGTIAGQLLIFKRPLLQLSILLCFAFALWAVLFASRRIHSEVEV